MKVIMLDVDGVLNCSTSNWNTEWPIDKDKADLVKRIKKETGAKVVLSSTWRVYEQGVKKVERMIGKLYGLTPNLKTKPRGEEIESWLQEHPEVTRYAIVDDDDDFDEGQPLFRTTFAKGLTEKIAGEIINYLNNE